MNALMKLTRVRNPLALSVLSLLSVASLFAGTAMKLTAARIPVPNSGQTVELQHLEYIADFQCIVKTLHFEQTSEEGADPIKGTWTFTAINTAGKVHRIDISVVLEDAKHKRMASYNAFMMVLAGAENQKLEIPMKVKSKKWAKTKSILIQANFTS
jgi:hypothetical protein